MAPSRSNPAPLAVVGISCRFPGDATNPEKLWDLLANKRSGWSEVPKDRWNHEAFWHPDPDDANGTNNAKGAHFINQDVGTFDASFFNVSPQEAAAMDPQQRLLLEIVYESIENAGIRQEEIEKSNTAVFMALFTRDYDRNLYKDMASLPRYQMTGTGDSILANRISHLFDLQGPSMTLDTGCSGGMAAIAQAAQVLRSGESDLALAGAVNLILTPDMMVGMSNLHMMNKDGKSYSFDNRGAGYGRGEGVATLVLKRLDDAIRDKDPIRAIIRDAALNQDGHTAGITLPSGEAQQSLESQLWSNIGVDPSEVGYIEAHGTGTLAGDSAELDGISRVFCSGRDAADPLLVGSIKSNIGHTECASGLAAIIKSIMIFEKGVIPPNVNFEDPRMSLEFEKKKIKIPETMEPWTKAGPKRISINNFGYGGTNAHAVLESYDKPAKVEAVEEDTSRLFVFSANNQASLKDMITSHAEWVANNGDQSSLRDLAYTLSQRRSLLPWRLSCVAGNKETLVEALEATAKKADSLKRIPQVVKVSFVFTGQGAQWAGMGKELLADPTFNESIQESRQILKDLGCKWDLVEELLKPKEESRLKEAELAQPATTCIQIALVDLAARWGIVPESVVGHSSGEIGAAYAAGYLNQFQAVKVAYVRGFSAGISKSKGLGEGGMLATGVGEDDIKPYLEKLTKGKAVVACQNSPSSTTISGDVDALTELQELLTEKSIFNRRLAVDTAYHSHHMQAAAAEYKEGLGNDTDSGVADTKVKMFSSVTGELKTGQFDPDYWTSNLVSRVRFCDALQALCQSEQTTSRASQHRIFIEMGPHSALAGPARQCIAGLSSPIPYNYISGLVRDQGAVDSALTMAGSVFSMGYTGLNLAEVSATDATSKNAVTLHNLPTYAWDHSKRYWHESRLSKDYRFRKHPYHDLLGLRMIENNPMRPAWRHMLGVEGLPWLRDHIVDGLQIFPAAGYMAMAMQAAVQLADDRSPGLKIERVNVKDIFFLKGLVIPEGRNRLETQLSFTPIANAGDSKNMEHSFVITAFTGNAGEEQWNEHCRGNVVVEFAVDDDKKLQGTPVTYGELVKDIDQSSGTHVPADELYEQMLEAGNHYGPTFVGIKKFYIAPDVSISSLGVPDIPAAMPANHMRPHIIHPSTLDIVLQTSLPLVSLKHGAGAVMPVHIDSMAINFNIANKPGSMFSSIATLTSHRFRAADADIKVFPDGDTSATPVIEIAAMELRSLGDGGAGGGAEDSREIGSTLRWAPDERFVTGKQIVADDKFALLGEYLKHKTFKQAGLRVLELGGTTGDATRAFVQALQANNAKSGAYDFVTKEPVSEEFQKELQDLAGAVSFKQLDISAETLEGFEPQSYDVVFSSSTLQAGGDETEKALSHIRSLLKADGVLLLINEADATEGLVDALSEASFKAQLTAHDSSETYDFTVARPDDDDDAELPAIRIVSDDSASEAVKAFVKDTSSALRRDGARVTAAGWDKKHVASDDVINIVIDDGSKPVLDGIKQEKLRQIIDLLQTPSKIVWVSVSDKEEDKTSARKHLITGVARSAHAENEDLDMVTVDVQQTLEKSSRRGILKFLSQIVRSFNNESTVRERHYVYTGADVLVPRVFPDESISRQVSGKADAVISETGFTSAKSAIRLDTSKNILSPVFVESEGFEEDLADDQVEIEAKAFAVPNPKAAVGVTTDYSGVVTAVGSAVSGLKVGDRVVAVTSTSCANRIRVPAAHAQALPSSVSFTTAAALPVALMTAAYTLVDVADVQAKQIVFVDGATGEVGQATVALALQLGAEVIAGVNSIEEANFLQKAFGLEPSHIVPRESHMAPRQIQNVVGKIGLDVIVGSSKTPVLSEIVQLLKPFGTLVHGNDASKYRGAVPANVTVSTFDVQALLQAKPHKTGKLLEQVVGFVNNGLKVDALKVTATPLGSIKEALKLAQQQDAIGKFVLEVQEDTTVSFAAPSYKVPKLEADATYVVSGGLGDLGPRLLALMTKAGAKHLVTLSRRGAATEKFAQVTKDLQAISPDVTLTAVKCDVSKEDSVQAALAEIKTKGLPPVKGVIQGAFMLKDCTLDTMTEDIFNSVLHTKVAGTLNLQKVFSAEDLTFFITMSSVVNVVGTLGQANYNAGNSVQDALAHFGNKDSGCFYMSLNIGIIADAELNNATIVASTKRQGLTLVSAEELNAYFEYALTADAREAGCHQAIIGFSPDTITETTAANGLAHTSMFTHVRPLVKAGAEDGAVEKKKSFKELMAEGADKEEIAAFVAQTIGDKLADLIGMSPADVDLSSSLSDLGLDSLVAIELRNWIMREYDAPLQSSEVLDSPDVWTMGQKVTLRSRIVNAAPAK